MKFTKQQIKHYIKEILFYFVTITLLTNFISLYKSQSLNKAPLQEKNFTFIDGSQYSIDRTKPLLIHFWATWCPTCKLEAANINLLAKHYQVITIAVKSGTNAAIKHYLQEHNYTFPVVNDKNSKLSQHFNVAAFPTTLIYDKDQKLRFAEVGYSSTFGLWLRLLWSSL